MSRKVDSGGRVRVPYRLPEDLADWYDRQAEARDVSVNLLVTRALEHYRAVMPPAPPEPGTADHLAEATAAMEAMRR